MGAHQRSNHILIDGTLAPRGGVSKVKPYPPWRGPGPETGRIKSQTICSLTGPWPREGAYQRSNHIILDGALAPRRGRIKGQTLYSLTGPLPREGAYKLSNHLHLDGALASRRGHIEGQAIYFLTGPWPREGAYQESNHIVFDGALAPGEGRIKGLADRARVEPVSGSQRIASWGVSMAGLGLKRLRGAVWGGAHWAHKCYWFGVSFEFLSTGQ